MKLPITEHTGKRIDGWKAIAAYFRRDRTTVMRWARESNLPVRRMPGGRQGSVFAFEHELAAWSLTPDRIDAGTVLTSMPAPVSVTVTPVPRRILRRPLLLMLAATLVAGAAIGGYWVLRMSWSAMTAPQSALPSDPAIAADYMAARDRWAMRTPQDIARSIVLYRSVIKRDPTFAPAHSGLAEAWLVYREYGSVDDPTAYNEAQKAAERAIKLDPNLPGAHRALGFIKYWWNNELAESATQFEYAIRLDDHDYQSHFWYANVLADMGDDLKAQREYNRARLLSPGSRVIEVEYACSKWQAGNDQLAMSQLTALSKQYPDDATIHNCLAWVHISSGDISNFAREYRLAALARGEPSLLRLTEQLSIAVKHDPQSAHRVLLAHARIKLAEGSMRIRETPAFFASTSGDRAELMKLLTEARNLGERWPSASVRRRIARRWSGDSVIQQLIIDLSPPAVSENIRLPST